MADQDQPPAALDHRANAGQSHFDPAVIRNLQVIVERDIEVDPHQDTLSLYVHIFDRFFCHGPIASSC